MTFLRDEGSVFDAPVDAVWEFLGSGGPHSDAHRHRDVERSAGPRDTGTYTWTQEFRGRRERFAMRWHAFPPLGLAYEVLDGPFAGSRFFLYYTPAGDRTGVTVVGDFLSPSIPGSELEAAVRSFFAREFEEDQAAIRSRRPPRPSVPG